MATVAHAGSAAHATQAKNAASSSSSSSSATGVVMGVPTVASGVSSPLSPSLDASSSLVLTPAERQLFCTHPVSALKQLSEDKRNASDDKKEELRQLVGIRYRVLIETADTIAHMERLVGESAREYAEMQRLLPDVGLAASSQEKGQQLAAPNATPTQLQLLLLLRTYTLAPVSIWHALDAHDFEAAITLYLSMQEVAARLEQVEHWPIDSQKDHPDLKALIDTAVQAHAAAGSAPATTSPSLAAALSSFFRHHASYYLELPSLIAYVASRRLAHRSLSARSYSDSLCALAMVSSEPRANLGAFLIDQFLSARRKQVHDLLWSAECALERFATSRASSSATPVVAHACQQVVFVLQYTILDVALLFGSLSSANNPHAALINKTNSLVQAFAEANVPERVAAMYAKAQGGAASHSTPPFPLDATLLSSKMTAWLQSIAALLSSSLSTLLSHLLSRRSPCASFASLRQQVLSAVDWREARSAEREEEQAEKKETEEARRRQAEMDGLDGERDRTPEEKESSANPATPALKSTNSVDAAAVTRKRMVDRWSDACTILFGHRAAPLDSSASPDGAFASPVDLFHLLFFHPFHTFTDRLITRAFERALGLGKKVEQHLVVRVPGKDDAKKEPQRKKLIASGIEEDEDDAAEVKLASSDAAGPSAPAGPPASELHGAREASVQSLIDAFHLQLAKLGRECGAILKCDVASVSNSSRYDAPAAMAPFPLLQRYLDEELTPTLTKRYNQLVEKLVDQLKVKLQDLERSVLSSMSDVTSWRSAATLALVDQSVFIGRVCHELMKQRHLMALETLLAHAAANAPNKSTTPRSASHAASTANNAANPIHLALATTARTAFRVWTRYVAAVSSEDLAEEVSKWVRAQQNIEARGAQHAAAYFKQAFSAKNHTGAAPLGLLLPVHPTPCIAALLFSVHHHYYRAFGYHVHAEVLSWLLTDVATAALSVLEKKVMRGEIPGGLEEGEDVLAHLSNHAALQMMFDVQYLFGVLRLPASSAPAATKPAGPLKVDLSGSVGTGSDPRSRYGRLLAALEGHLAKSLDQIDWMTSKASFVANLHAAVSRSGMLYGVLAKANPFPATLPIGATATPGVGYEASTTVQTPMIALAPVAPKILPLPASLYPSRHPQPAPVAPVKTTMLASTLAATAGSVHAASSSHATSASTAPSSASTTTSSSGLSFSNLSSNLSSQLALANSSAAVNAKAIGELGSNLLGRLSQNSLWGTKKQ